VYCNHTYCIILYSYFLNSVSWPFNSLPAHDITSHNVCVYIIYAKKTFEIIILIIVLRIRRIIRNIVNDSNDNNSKRIITACKVSRLPCRSIQIRNHFISEIKIRFVVQCTTILNMQFYFEYFCIFYTLVLVHINCISCINCINCGILLIAY